MNLERLILQDLEQYIGEYESYIDDVIPLYKALKDNFKGGETPKIMSALAYFSAPLEEILPEEIYGPYAYVPHIYVAQKALEEKELSNYEAFCLELLNEEEIKKIHKYLGWD